MATVRELVNKIGFKVDKSQMTQAENSVKKMSFAMKGLLLGAVAGVAAIGAASIKAAADMETLQTSFEVMLGSADKASQMIEDLRAFSVKTPFELEDLAQASQTLLQFGLQGEDILPTVQMLGDVAGSNREKFKSLALVFGQIQSTGKLMGQDLLQLINQGFNPLQVISEKTGRSVADLKDDMSKGLISAEQVTEAFKMATSEGGLFFENMKKQSTTLTGLWSTMIGVLKDLLVTIGNTVMPVIKEVINLVIELAKGPLKEVVAGIMAIFVPLVGAISKLLTPLLESLVPVIEALSEALIPIIEVLMGILIPVLKAIMPLFDVIAFLIATIGDIIKRLNPVFEQLTGILLIVVEALMPLIAGLALFLGPALELVFQALSPLLQILLFLIRVALKPLVPLFWLLGKSLAIIGEIISGIVWIIDLLVLLGEWLLKIFWEFLLNSVLIPIWNWLKSFLQPVIDIIGSSLEFLHEIAMGLWDIIQWVWNKVQEFLSFVRGKAEAGIKPPSAVKSMQAGAKGTTNNRAQTNMNVKINQNISGGAKAGAADIAKEVRSQFALEFQKVLTNAGY